jgi:hypothetical protein
MNTFRSMQALAYLSLPPTRVGQEFILPLAGDKISIEKTELMWCPVLPCGARTLLLTAVGNVRL